MRAIESAVQAQAELDPFSRSGMANALRRAGRWVGSLSLLQQVWSAGQPACTGVGDLGGSKAAFETRACRLHDVGSGST